MGKKAKIETEKKVNIEELKRLSTKEIALKGNINPVLLVLADCDMKQYLKYRIMLITDKLELGELKKMYQTTDWWKEAINSMKESEQHGE